MRMEVEAFSSNILTTNNDIFILEWKYKCTHPVIKRCFLVGIGESFVRIFSRVGLKMQSRNENEQKSAYAKTERELVWGREIEWIQGSSVQNIRRIDQNLLLLLRECERKKATMHSSAPHTVCQFFPFFGVTHIISPHRFLIRYIYAFLLLPPISNLFVHNSCFFSLAFSRSL